MPRRDRLTQDVPPQQGAEPPPPKETPGRRAGSAKAPTQPTPSPSNLRVVSRMLERYRKEVVPALMEEFHYSNVMQVPHLKKVTLNIGLAEALQNGKAVEAASKDLEAISGQHPVVTRAHKAIAAFKLRAGVPLGTMVTLRGNRMYNFVDRLFNAVLPRMRDFRGIRPTSFDGQGNLSIGIREQVLFPEIDFNQMDKPRGLQVNINTTAATAKEAIRLLELLGLPFAKTGDKNSD